MHLVLAGWEHTQRADHHWLAWKHNPRAPCSCCTPCTCGWLGVKVCITTVVSMAAMISVSECLSLLLLQPLHLLWGRGWRMADCAAAPAGLMVWQACRVSDARQHVHHRCAVLLSCACSAAKTALHAQESKARLAGTMQTHPSKVGLDQTGRSVVHAWPGVSLGDCVLGQPHAGR